MGAPTVVNVWRAMGVGRKISPKQQAALAPPGRGGDGAARSGEQHRGLLRGPGRGRAARPHSLPGCRSGMLRVPGGRLRQAFHLLHGDLRGAGLTSKPEGTYTTE